MLGATLALTACSTVDKNWSAVGGSKGDGTVKLAYEYTEFEVPSINIGQGNRIASQRCKAWGYNKAEAFEGETKSCVNRGGLSGCREWIVTREFQCTGNNGK